MIFKIFFFLVILSQILMTVSGIKCYQCNSVTNEECQDLGAYTPHLTAQFFKDCAVNDFNNGSSLFCRKTVLSVKFPETIKRTIRSCGWMKSHLPCYRADNDDHTELQCQCFDDGCNGSTRVDVIRVLPFITFSALYFSTKF